MVSSCSVHLWGEAKGSASFTVMGRSYMWQPYWEKAFFIHNTVKYKHTAMTQNTALKLQWILFCQLLFFPKMLIPFATHCCFSHLWIREVQLVSPVAPVCQWGLLLSIIYTINVLKKWEFATLPGASLDHLCKDQFQSIIFTGAVQSDKLYIFFHLLCFTSGS